MRGENLLAPGAGVSAAEREQFMSQLSGELLGLAWWAIRIGSISVQMGRFVIL